MAKFKQGKLSYKLNQLEPFIDEETMDLHYNTHHRNYVDGLAKIDKLFGEEPLHVLLKNLALFNERNLTPQQYSILIRNGGGHYNHTIFFQLFTKTDSANNLKEADLSKFEIIRALRDKWGTDETFRIEFEKRALELFGGGWCWLVYVQGDEKITISYSQDYGYMCIPSPTKTETSVLNPGNFYILLTDRQESPIMFNQSLFPLISLDLWEHSYYKKFQGNKLEYMRSFWNVLDWEKIDKIFTKICRKEKPLAITNQGLINLDEE